MNRIINPHRRRAFACIGIIIPGIVMIFLPGMIGLDGFKGGYALAFLGVLVAIAGIISIVVFMRLANLQDSIVNESTILAHWTYSPEEWRQYIEKEHVEDKTGKRSLLLFVAVISIIIGVILSFVYPDGRLAILLTVLGIIIVLGVTALLSSSASYRWNKNHPGEVYIARDGAYFSGRLYIWKGLGTSLDGITWEDTEGSPRIMIKYSSLSVYRYVVRVPVPQGQEETARKAVSEIQSSYLP